MKLLCVPKRKGTGNQRPYVIMWRPYLHFRFWYNMPITLGSLCKKILSNSFEETVLWLWTLKEKKVNKKKEFRTFAGCYLFLKLPCNRKSPGFMSYTKPWNAERIGLGQWWQRCHLNLLMIIFATPAGEHKCKKEHLEFPKKSGNQWNPKKVLYKLWY